MAVLSNACGNGQDAAYTQGPTIVTQTQACSNGQDAAVTFRVVNVPGGLVQIPVTGPK